MIYIFNQFNKFDERLYQKLYNMLPHSRKEKVDKLRYKLDKKISVLEYFLVKFVLKIKGLPDFQYNENGKPFFAGKYFNISHQEDVLVVAVGKNEIGVDIQKELTYDDRLAKYICNNEEYESLNRNNKNLTELWVKKEAMVKCNGGNLFYDIKNILNNKLNNKFSFFYFKNYHICVCEKS